MGNSSSEVLNTDLLIERIRDIRSSLTVRDRSLLNHAKFALAQETETCNDCELFIDFEDREGLTIQSNRNPSGRIFVGYDENDKPKYVWEKRGFWRAAKKYFVDGLKTLRRAAQAAMGGVVAAISGAVGRRAIEN